MKAKDIATYSLKDWTGTDAPFAVTPLNGEGEETPSAQAAGLHHAGAAGLHPAQAAGLHPAQVAGSHHAGAAGARDLRAQPHRNSFYTIYWITAGEVKVTIDAVTYSVFGDTLLFVAPGQVLQMVETQTARGWWIGFDEQFYCIRDPAAARSNGVDSMLFST